MEIIRDNARMDAIMCDPTLDVQRVFLLNEETMQVHFQTKEEFIKDSRRHQPIINAYVTSFARIYLYKAIKTVQDRNLEILYCDTDSMIILKPKSVEDEGIYKHGTIFGGWKDEAGEGRYVKNFRALRYVLLLLTSSELITILLLS